MRRKIIKKCVFFIGVTTLAILIFMTFFNLFSFRDTNIMFYYLVKSKQIQNVSASIKLKFYPKEKTYILSTKEASKLLKLLKKSKPENIFPRKVIAIDAIPFICLNIKRKGLKRGLNILYYGNQLYFESLLSTNQIDNEELKKLVQDTLSGLFLMIFNISKYKSVFL